MICTIFEAHARDVNLQITHQFPFATGLINLRRNMAMIQVRSYDNYIPANMMLQRLEEEGIRGYLKDEYTVTIDPILTNAIGGIKLMIHEVQVERALELITRFEQEYNEAAICPRCNSSNIHYITQPNNVTNWFTAVVTWLFGNFTVSFKKVSKCSDCGFQHE